MSSNSSSWNSQTWVAMEPELTEQERAVRDRFVEEYLVDYSPVRAARRVGFSSSFAKEYAERFMQESYVARKIEELKHKNVDEADREEYDKRRIRERLMHIAHDHFAPPSAAVAALSKLMSLYGMDAPTRIKQDIEHRGGVMMVPAIASLDDWERTAMALQQKLAETARSDIH